MFKMSKVEVTRAEGLIELCRQTKVFTNFDDANKEIGFIAATNTSDKCSDKTDFAITFEDGVEYSGTMCVYKDNFKNKTIQNHVKDYLNCFLQSTCVKEDTIKDTQDFLNNYELV